MSIWGKILGGMTGFAMGGPFGAVVGAALGHAADEGAAKPPELDARPEAIARITNRDQLFSISVIVLSAKLAKCDGPVKREEIDAFKRAFRIPQENQREVGLLFDKAREDAGGYESFANRLGEAFADNPAMLEEVLSALHHIARADGQLTRNEAIFLARVRQSFRLDDESAERASASRPPPSQTPAVDPYAVLGVTRSATDDEVRQAWRRLMREHHPDIMAARGVPEALMRRASERVAEINAAWDSIKRERGL
ncbi:TerB family tellurite resistance protein [Roseomonas sp. GC11]|uniref:TerB family tellurite resistance protein n=1 Tax=Roseomonas sp. GC11 TaxID=2950546 RepID=UPI00210C6242|nr:TerB family tellurite resistance protein [Roseomonas sp. GC11]MCQ4162503.1 TerB family tellurite resistance protein [Roseomonas sp. GC11]